MRETRSVGPVLLPLAPLSPHSSLSSSRPPPGLPTPANLPNPGSPDSESCPGHGDIRCRRAAAEQAERKRTRCGPADRRCTRWRRRRLWRRRCRSRHRHRVMGKGRASRTRAECGWRIRPGRQERPRGWVYVSRRPSSPPPRSPSWRPPSTSRPSQPSGPTHPFSFGSPLRLSSEGSLSWLLWFVCTAGLEMLAISHVA